MLSIRLSNFATIVVSILVSVSHTARLPAITNVQPVSMSTKRPLESRAFPTFYAYHGASSAVHQQNFQTYGGSGYRMISLCLYGDVSDPEYAAVWVQRIGPAWQAINFTDTTGLNQFIATWEVQGYVLTLISAIGSTSSPMWTAVMEVQSTSGVGQKEGQWFYSLASPWGPVSLSYDETFQYWNSVAHNNSLILRSITSYGSGADLLLGAVWGPNPYDEFQKWHAHVGDTVVSYQAEFDQETSLPGYRPYYVTVSSDQQIASVFGDSVVGDWVARHNMTGDEYQAAFDEYTADGLYPINVQAGGSGASAMYAAIFAQIDAPYARTFSTDDGQVHSALVPLADVESTMQTFMTNNSIRSAQLAIYNDGVLVKADGYDWSEQGNRLTSATDQFMLAGLSEIFVAAAIQSIFSGNQLNPSDKAYSTLGLSGGQDARADTITIQQLVDHTSGYASDISGYDPVFDMRNIATDLGISVPLTKGDVVQYVYFYRSLDLAPGAEYHDSNYGYLLLSNIVEKVTGLDYMAYLNEKFVGTYQLNVTDWPTVSSPRPSTEVTQEDEGLGESAVNTTSTTLVPAVYGGDGMIKEVAIGPLGLAGSASDIALFIHQNAVQGIGGRASGNSRVSSIAGGLAYAESRNDSIDWAFVVNTRDWSGHDGIAPQNDLIAAINQIIDTQVV